MSWTKVVSTMELTEEVGVVEEERVNGVGVGVGGGGIGTADGDGNTDDWLASWARSS